MIADPEGPSFIVRTVGHRRYTDGAFVTHDPEPKFISLTLCLESGPKIRIQYSSRLVADKAADDA